MRRITITVWVENWDSPFQRIVATNMITKVGVQVDRGRMSGELGSRHADVMAHFTVDTDEVVAG